MMKLSLIAFALLACWAVGVQSEDVESAWEHHKAHFPVKASSAEEREKRRSLFAASHDEIERHNRRNHSFQMAHNQFSTMTDSEKKAFLGFNPKAARKMMNTHSTLVAADVRDLPASVDLRTHKCMNPVKNQAQCGSCWAFSATAPVEFGTCLKTGKNVLLSEQQLVDCSTGNNGCNGGWYDEAWMYLVAAGGQATSASYGYTARTGTCKASQGVVAARVSGVSYAPIPDFMLALLAENRLVSVVFAIIKSFYFYQSGVYAVSVADCANASLIMGYHAVVAVGYGTLNGVDYWIIRNSWGSSWGAAGYILFQRGVDLCGIENSGNAASADVV